MHLGWEYREVLQTSSGFWGSSGFQEEVVQAVWALLVGSLATHNLHASATPIELPDIRTHDTRHAQLPHGDAGGYRSCGGLCHIMTSRQTTPLLLDQTTRFGITQAPATAVRTETPFAFHEFSLPVWVPTQLLWPRHTFTRHSSVSSFCRTSPDDKPKEQNCADIIVRPMPIQYVLVYASIRETQDKGVITFVARQRGPSLKSKP